MSDPAINQSSPEGEDQLSADFEDEASTETDVGFSSPPGDVKSEEDVAGGPKFYPTACQQRYQAVKNAILQCRHQIKTVVDFGCAELHFSRIMKFVKTLTLVAAVDIDKPLLQLCRFKLRPLPADFLQVFQERKEPMRAVVYAGSIVDHDPRLKGVDAVTCIELIEHLQPDVLSCVPTTIFGYMKPKVCMMTTPNAEFNVLFPGFQGFRHWDHKFEWTRPEFQEWCNAIIASYPDYEVEFSNIAMGPEGTEHLGGCSQMATFTLKDASDHEGLSTRSKEEEEKVDGPYELIDEYIYPAAPKLDANTKFINEFVYSAYTEARATEEYQDGMAVKIPVEDIMSYPGVQKLEFPLKEAMILIGKEFSLEEVDGVNCIVIKPDASSSSSPSHSCTSSGRTSPQPVEGGRVDVQEESWEQVEVQGNSWGKLDTENDSREVESKGYFGGQFDDAEEEEIPKNS